MRQNSEACDQTTDLPDHLTTLSSRNLSLKMQTSKRHVRCSFAYYKINFLVEWQKKLGCVTQILLRVAHSTVVDFSQLLVIALLKSGEYALVELQTNQNIKTRTRSQLFNFSKPLYSHVTYICDSFVIRLSQTLVIRVQSFQFYPSIVQDPSQHRRLGP